VRPRVTPDDAAYLAFPELLWHRRPRRYNHGSDPAAELFRERRQQFAIPAEDCLGVGDVVEHWATNDGSVLPDLVAPECEGRDDTEVATAAPERPKQVLM